jgi:hypothetical protein
VLGQVVRSIMYITGWDYLPDADQRIAMGSRDSICSTKYAIFGDQQLELTMYYDNKSYMPTDNWCCCVQVLCCVLVEMNTALTQRVL